MSHIFPNCGPNGRHEPSADQTPLLPIKHLLRIGMILMYGLLFVLCGFGAFLLRFDFEIRPDVLPFLIAALAIWAPAKLVIWCLDRMDKDIPTFLSQAEVTRIVWVILKGSFFGAVLIMILAPPGFPRSLYFIDLALCVLSVLGLRVVLRHWQDRLRSERRGQRRRILVYGAGCAGELLMQDIQGNPRIPYAAIGFVDDNPTKRRMVVHGVPVVGQGWQLPELVRTHQIDRVLIAVPSASGQEMTTILQHCWEARVECKTVPGMDQLLESSGLIGQIRDVDVEDLLGRRPAELDEVKIGETLRGRVVLVTGAGGSIGSELCRQIARFDPKTIVGYEISENALYELNSEMSETFPDIDFIPAVGSIQNEQRLAEVMVRYRPTVLYHAAAYKHVPMMEAHLFEALENNVFGTLKVVQAAADYRVERFVLISSDKAVGPTNVMGATKRVAELIANSMRTNGTKCVAVRFGNVLGSNGSVIPRFKRQIYDGGPVTVTHPEMERYFMTISEAVQLVLQASVMGKGGEVFVLDMGQPVKIVDLARKLILLSGLRPDKDIQIAFSGIRPGEKLREELNTILETTVPTHHQKIRIFTGPGISDQEMVGHLEGLRRSTAKRDAPTLVSQLQEVVVDYQPSGHVLEAARKQKQTAWDLRNKVIAIGASG